MFDGVKRLFGQEKEQEGCFPSLSFTERLIGFGICTILGYFIQLMSFGSIIGVATGSPSKFAISYSIGNVLSLFGQFPHKDRILNRFQKSGSENDGQLAQIHFDNLHRVAFDDLVLRDGAEERVFGAVVPVGANLFIRVVRGQLYPVRTRVHQKLLQRLSKQGLRIIMRSKFLLLSLLLVNKTPFLSLSNSSWMASLPEHALISSLQLLGSHDSFAYSHSNTPLFARLLSWLWKTQDMTIEQQLQKGVRVLDCRVEPGDSLNLMHGIINLKISLEQALSKIQQFLDKNPSEFVVLLLKIELQNEDRSSAQQKILRVLEKGLKKRVGVEEKRALRVGEMRGKVLVLARNFKDKSTYGSLKFKNNTIFKTQTSIGTFIVQDLYNCSNLEKLKAVRNAIALRTASSQVLINFFSGYSGMLPLPRLFCEQVRAEEGERMGWGVFDFVEEKIINQWIERNQKRCD